MEESLLKSNFIGRDGFRWWIGQIPPVTSWFGQANKKGWGNRYKVRILGYHPYNKGDLPDEELPWATVLIPPTSGTGGANFAKSVKIRPGDVVMGFFLDGDNGQIPVIMGAFGRTKQVPQDSPSESFVPFTGYTDNIPVPNNTVAASEANEADDESQKSPRTTDKKTVDKINENKKEGELKEIPISSTFGLVEIPADACADNFIGSVSGTLDNLFSKVGDGTNLLQNISSATEKIKKLANAPITASMESLYTNLIPNISGGLERLYQTEYSKEFALQVAKGSSPSVAEAAATLKGIAAQKGQINPIKSLQNELDCLGSKIANGLTDTVRGLIEEALTEVVNTGTCITEQFAGSLLSSINDKISEGLETPLSGIDKIVSAGTVVKDILGASSDTFKSVGNLLDCNQSNSNCVGKVKKWTIGKGSTPQFNFKETYDNVTKNINQKSNGSSSFPRPDCSTPSFCAPPTVTFFGGSGSGGLGRAILGEFVSNTDGLSEVTADVSRTASIIGVEITDPGSDYFYYPPLISFDDPCSNGYGAVGRAVIDWNPLSTTYGQITGVTMISEGENYPVVNNNDDISDQAINSDQVPMGVIATQIVTGGNNYVEGETIATDGNTEYSLTIDNGEIISAIPINSVEITNLPKIRISSLTGTGAFIKPIIGRLPTTPQGEIIQIIDCVGPDTNIIGYVRGKPYSGPFHLHPSRGVKMVGAVHINQPHEIIYDTLDESLETLSTIKTGITTSLTTTEREPTITPTSTPTPTPTQMPDTSSSPYTPPSPPPSSPPSGGGGYGGGY
tara:strand:+ start:4202 stop:6571 length:2370 start_codon:yes stop_codon:yes gene_type:complete